MSGITGDKTHTGILAFFDPVKDFVVGGVKFAVDEVEDIFSEVTGIPKDLLTYVLIGGAVLFVFILIK